VRAFTQKSSNILPITRFELKLETSARVCVLSIFQWAQKTNPLCAELGTLEWWIS